jgi:c(7)-type cytochrome triheme protein
LKKMFVAAVIVGALSISPDATAQPAGGGDLTFVLPNALPVLFSHSKHVKERGLKCSGCHYQLFQMARGSYKIEMGKITKGEFCGRCHNGRLSFDAQDPQQCSRCHR